ncbi:rhodanese-like domain-containing protein [Algoriphagus sp. CAU 1675]|uniref:rhodanese-like domain-containing protein n=1 Tax=Algoriphagus sp. CAU 1675 TaxID=3032597 RepID=UPI0023DB3691|nr:rhodanese-like domain-containing protein [Algoriphagus sp. CAU 1675]MDF2158442.1 rhodanese-like domain-containing protein [Algoriphagus sp. CAU 1675]
MAYKALLMTLYENDFPVLKPIEITDLDKFNVLDAREEEEFKVSHLPGATWVGFDTFSMKNVESLDKEKPVLIYCTVGARSQEIGKRLREAGFKQVFNLYGGIIEWSNQGRTLESDGKPTTKVHTYSKSWGIWLTKGEKVY